MQILMTCLKRNVSKCNEIMFLLAKHHKEHIVQKKMCL